MVFYLLACCLFTLIIFRFVFSFEHIQRAAVVIFLHGTIYPLTLPTLTTFEAIPNKLVDSTSIYAVFESCIKIILH